MTEIRCVKCGRLLMKISDPWTRTQIAISREGVQIKCPKCGYVNQFTFAVNPNKYPKVKDGEIGHLEGGIDSTLELMRLR
jgi:phage FluMu protein Com